MELQMLDWAHLFGSKTPLALRTSAKTGTVELTGLEMTRMKALGQALAIASARVAQIPALICEGEDAGQRRRRFGGAAGATQDDSRSERSSSSLLRG
jgi:hypothetical protein